MKKLQQHIETMLDDTECLLMIHVELLLPKQVTCCNRQNLEAFTEYLTSFINKDSSHQSSSHVLYRLYNDTYQVIILVNQQTYPNMTNHSASHITELTAHIKQAWSQALSCEIATLFEKIKYPINPISAIRNRMYSYPSAFSN